MTDNLARVAAAALLVAAITLLSAGAASGYSCGNTHCYGTNSWSQAGEYFGAYSDIQIAELSCPDDGFVDDEMWLVDTSSPGCRANEFGMCWVEVGYSTYPGRPLSYFWADGRPLTSSTYNEHILGPTDPVGTVDHFMIVKDGRVNPQTYLVFVYNDSRSTLYNGVSAVPPGTAQMVGRRIDIGQELFGSGGASASTALFTLNRWAVQALGPEYVFWYAVQGAKGAVTSNNPPKGQWVIDPGSCNAVEGGEFSTSCCN
jgi:hypothetical protein